MTLPTPRDYLGIHTVHAECNACGHTAKLDLQKLVEVGYGNVPLVELPLTCTACGRRGHRIQVAGRSGYRMD